MYSKNALNLEYCLQYASSLGSVKIALEEIVFDAFE